MFCQGFIEALVGKKKIQFLLLIYSIISFDMCCVIDADEILTNEQITRNLIMQVL
jgi:hypothetical protein